MADDQTRLAETLYEADYVAWAEAQAAALRARASGRNALDYDNLAEEIEDLGKSETNACASQIDSIIKHLLKIEFVGPLQTVPHWRGEIYGFRRRLGRHRTKTIDNRLMPSLPEAYISALKTLETQGLLSPTSAAFSVLDGYTWDQIIDPNWYPEPRYAD